MGVNCAAWIRLEHQYDYPAVIWCDKGFDHTGHHENEENAATWNQ